MPLALTSRHGGDDSAGFAGRTTDESADRPPSPEVSQRARAGTQRADEGSLAACIDERRRSSSSALGENVAPRRGIDVVLDARVEAASGEQATPGSDAFDVRRTAREPSANGAAEPGWPRPRAATRARRRHRGVHAGRERRRRPRVIDGFVERRGGRSSRRGRGCGALGLDGRVDRAGGDRVGSARAAAAARVSPAARGERSAQELATRGRPDSPWRRRAIETSRRRAARRQGNRGADVGGRARRRRSRAPLAHREGPRPPAK